MSNKKEKIKDYSIMNKIDSIVAQDLNENDGVLAEDKAIYDRCHLSEAGIKFGSKSFYSWKKENANLYFPSLDAPWEVRRAWREFNESQKCKEDIFVSFEEQIHFNITKPNGFFSGVRLKSITDYKNLFNLAFNIYKDFYERTSNKIYKEYISFLIS
ncbi:MAG: hypothetical protein E7213_10155 [Clostridium sp.]|nr:hypothetical protein [Clostridium sp.]